MKSADCYRLAFRGSPKRSRRRIPGARRSIDIPTGVDADTAEADPYAVAADCTVTFILPKLGMTRGKGRELSGQIRIFPLGLPINFADIALGPNEENEQE